MIVPFFIFLGVSGEFYLLIPEREACLPSGQSQQNLLREREGKDFLCALSRAGRGLVSL